MKCYGRHLSQCTFITLNKFSGLCCMMYRSYSPIGRTMFYSQLGKQATGYRSKLTASFQLECIFLDLLNIDTILALSLKPNTLCVVSRGGRHQRAVCCHMHSTLVLCSMDMYTTRRKWNGVFAIL